jgi:hypothetical protein
MMRSSVIGRMRALTKATVPSGTSVFTDSVMARRGRDTGPDAVGDVA